MRVHDACYTSGKWIVPLLCVMRVVIAGQWSMPPEHDVLMIIRRLKRIFLLISSSLYLTGSLTLRFTGPQELCRAPGMQFECHEHAQPGPSSSIFGRGALPPKIGLCAAHGPKAWHGTWGMPPDCHEHAEPLLPSF